LSLPILLHPPNKRIRIRINEGTFFGFSYYFANICILLSA
jgi:hypothetical protein